MFCPLIKTDCKKEECEFWDIESFKDEGGTVIEMCVIAKCLSRFAESL